MIGGKTVVYTSGTFDMLHINHLRLIEYARGLGDILIVGVNTDELVASYKSTPMIPFEDRIALMRAIKGPDLVIPQHSLDHHDKVKKLKQLIQQTGSHALIEVDGGVNGTTGRRLVQAGVDVLVAGSYVFGAENPEERIKELKTIDG